MTARDPLDAPGGRFRRRGWPTALAVAGAGLTVFALSACPSVFFGDSGELIAAAHSLGVAHPPGYPLYTLLGRLALLAPVGEPAWRMNLLSALAGALACAAVAWLTVRWTGSRSAAWGAAAGLGLGGTFWSAATVAEVYTLHLFLVALLLVAAVEAGWTSGGGVSWVLLATTLGLGLAHRPTILLALPAALVLAWPGLAGLARAGGRALAGVVAGLALPPLLLYGGLLARAQAAPGASWGHPRDVASLWALVTTRAYGHYRVGAAGWLNAESWTAALGLLGRDLGYLGLPLALIGLFAAFGRAGPVTRRVAWALFLLAAGGVLFALTYGTQDVEVLFLTPLLALSLAAGLGLGAVARIAGRRAALVGLGLALTIAALQAWRHAPTRILRDVTAAADYGRDMLATVPADGVLFVEGDDAFLLAYLTRVSGLRPDVTIYDRLGLLFRDEAGEPGSAPRAGESALEFRVRREREFVAREFERPRPRPLLFMTWPGYELGREWRFEPVGLFYRVRRASDPPADPAALWRGYAEARVREQALRLEHPLALTVAATYPLMRGERARFEGDWSGASRWFDEASRLARASESIHNYLGTIFGRAGDYRRAQREFEEAIRILPVSVRAWNNLALAKQLAGDLDGARHAWERSLELSPGQPEVRRRLQRR